MAKSLNPNAGPPGGSMPPSPPSASALKIEPAIAPRRNLLAGIAAVFIGSFVGIVPFAAGLATFLDPLWRQKRGGKQAERSFRRVASLEVLPSDGTPIQVPVVADL